LAAQLLALKQERGAEVCVLIVPTTRPETIEQFGIRVAEAWKLGRQGIDDGAILIVALEDREVRIEVGRGLEGDIPDLKANRIIDEQVLPWFRERDIVAGVSAGTRAIIALVNRAEIPPPAAPGKPGPSWPFVVVPVLFVLGSVAAEAFGPFRGAIGTGILGFFVSLVFGSLLAALGIGLAAFVLVLFHEPIFFIINMLRIVGGGGGGGWSSRGDGFGSGGTFGGGGASGRW